MTSRKLAVWCLTGVLMAGVAAWAADAPQAAPAKETPAKAAAEKAAPAKAAPEKPVQAQVAPEKAAPMQEKPDLRYGADIRVREEIMTDHQSPILPPPKGSDTDWIRVRPRVWAEYDPMDDVMLRLRVVNEFRNWFEPDQTAKSTGTFPDEYVFDNMFIDVKGLMDKQLDLRVGRQELMYGTGKVLFDGTPGDGSRTAYYNAIKATWKGVQDVTMDFLGIWNPQNDELSINPPSPEKNLNGYIGALDSVYESGGGLYMVNKSCKDMPWEGYALYKEEGAYETKGQPSRAWQTATSTTTVENAQANIGTLGFRLMPQFCPMTKGNLEAAYQLGERGDESISAYMVDAFMNHQLPVLEDIKPAAEYGVYWLSGDDPSTDKDEGWDPLWSRQPQYSELYGYWFPVSAFRWSNLIMPRANLMAIPAKWLKMNLMGAYLMADEEDGAGKGTGDERGWLEVATLDFNFGEKLLTNRDKLTGHLWLELFQPGDYHASEDSASFLRWQFLYAF